MQEKQDLELEKTTKLSEELKENFQELKKIEKMIEFKTESNPYIQEIFEKYHNFDNYIQVVTKKLPENIFKLTLEEGFSQYIIENKLNDQSHIYNFVGDSKIELIESTRYLWGNLSIPEKIDEFNIESILDKLISSLNALQQYHQIDIISNLGIGKGMEKTLQNTILKIVQNYSSNSYMSINKALTSKEPLLLEKMGYYLNLMIENHKKVIVGQKFDSRDEIKLYRGANIKKELLKLYKKGQYIFFTNFTSVSKSISISQGFKNPSAGEFVEFQFKLINLKEQEKLHFFSGISIQNVSHYPGEEEILILPYQFFYISDVIKNKTHWIVELDEVADKKLIDYISVKKNIEGNIVKDKIKKIDIDEMKKTLNKEMQKTEDDMKINKEEIKKIEIILETGINKIFQKNAQNEKFDLQMQMNEEINKIFKVEELQNVDKKSVFDPILSQNVVELEKSLKLVLPIIENQLYIEEYLKLKAKSIKELNDNYEVFIDKLMKKFNITIFDEFSTKDFLTSKLICLDDQNETQTHIKRIVNLLKINADFFKNLIIEGEEANEELITDFLFIILKQLFETINQDSIYSQNYIKSLLYHYHCRLTIGNLNNNIIKLIINADLKKYSLKQTFEKIFAKDSSLKNYYFKIIFSGIEDFNQGHNKISQVLFIYCETNVKSSIFQVKINKYLKEFDLILLDYKQLNRFDKLLFHQDMLSKNGNKDYSFHPYQSETRGYLIYNFPNGYKRFGLKVKDGEWLGITNIEENWPVAYTTVKDIIFNEKIFGKSNDYFKTQLKCPNISQNGIQCVNNVKKLEGFLDKIEIFGRNYVMAFQCRIDPNEVQFSNTDEEIYVLDRSKSDIIRPYGVLIKEI